MQGLMRQYSDKTWKASLTEFEVFIGNIMGESHKQTKRQKDDSKSMRDGEYILNMHITPVLCSTGS
jgi:hypothetical protein